jgi:hypothetical protein
MVFKQQFYDAFALRTPCGYPADTCPFLQTHVQIPADRVQMQMQMQMV